VRSRAAGLSRSVRRSVVLKVGEVSVEMRRIPGSPEIGLVPYLAFGFTNRLGNTDIRLGALTIDNRVRIECEYLMEAAANSVAVCYGCQRKIGSQLVPYALQANTSDETTKLATLRAYPHELKVRHGAPRVGITPAAYLEIIERIDIGIGRPIRRNCRVLERLPSGTFFGAAVLKATNDIGTRLATSFPAAVDKASRPKAG
jgi:hypothetical protein